MKIERAFWMILILVLLALFGYGVYYHYSTVNSMRGNYSNVISAISDTVSYYRNENGELVARISTITMDNYKDFLNIKTRDSLIMELQRIVALYKDRVESVTNFTVIGEVSGSSPTIADTIYIDTIPVSPVYRSHYLDAWIDMINLATIDSISFNLKYTDKLTVTQLSDATGDYVEIRSQSPYATPTNVTTFRIKHPVQKPKNWGIGVQIGYGISHIDNKFQTSPYVGIGVSYNLFNW